MVRKYARTAISTNALIIHACECIFCPSLAPFAHPHFAKGGYDSVPSDLTTFLAVQRLKALMGENGKVGPVRSAFSFKGGASGGTVSTALTMMDGSPEDRAIGTNPYALSPSELLVSCYDSLSLELISHPSSTVAGTYKPLPTVVTSSTFAGKKTWGAFWVMVCLSSHAAAYHTIH
jgi:hypothetical protein